MNYVGTLDDGTQFDSSTQGGRTPLEFVIGSGSMIQGFEDAVRTMKVGETKTVRIEAKDAYGEAYTTKTVPISDYHQVQNSTIPRTALIGNLQETVSKSQALGLLGSVDIGTTKMVGEATLKVLSVSGDNVTIAIDDPTAPFYNKTLSV